MTAKIQFKLSNDVLLTVIHMIEQTEDYVIQSIKDALLVSIKEDLIIKLADKAKTIQKQTSILDHNKKHVIVLKYHEAYTMYKLLEAVYNKGTFADHIHAKKINRLLADLEQKVENFTTEQVQETSIPTAASGEDCTLTEQKLLVDTNLKEHNTMDLVDLEQVKDIPVVNYSIFDLFETQSVIISDTSNEIVLENNTKLTEVTEDLFVIEETILENNIELTEEAEELFITDESILENSFEPTEETEDLFAIDKSILENSFESTEETENLFVIDEPILENNIESTEETEDLFAIDKSILENNIEPTEEIEELFVIDEPILENNIESTEEIEDSITFDDSSIFNGIVSTSSICIEEDNEIKSDSTSNLFDATQQSIEESLNLFEEQTNIILEQEEKPKKERKKKITGNPAEGQISLF